MPIRLPSQTIIDASDFKNSSYNFSVESVLSTKTPPGHLIISISTGYLLTTSQSEELRREKTLDYIQQADGSWIASGDVTVSLTGEAVTDGRIVVQNSLTESAVITILGASVALEKPQRTVLAVNKPTLTFAPTVPGKPSFLVLTIIQQYGDAPVTLTTDATDLFQLATDGYPRFSPTLTFNPSPIGSYVHVRYLADKHGLHTAQLQLTSDFENREVTLTGRSKGLLPAIRRTPNPLTMSKWLPELLAVLAFSGLALASYSNRCQLFPALCQNTSGNPVEVQTNRNQSAFSKVDATVTKNDPGTLAGIPKLLIKTEKLPRLKYKQLINKGLINELATRQPKNAVRTAVPNATKHRSFSDQNLTNNLTNKQSSRQAVSVQPMQESDLERYLNHTVPPQP